MVLLIHLWMYPSTVEKPNAQKDEEVLIKGVPVIAMGNDC